MSVAGERHTATPPTMSHGFSRSGPQKMDR